MSASHAPSVWRCIITGCGNLPGYGPHPGTAYLVALVLLGGIAGLQRGWEAGPIGAGVMLAVFGPMYLYGAFERGKAYARSIAKAKGR